MGHKFRKEQIERVLYEIYETNRYYVATSPTKLRQKISGEQTPIATLVMCCDSRAHTTSFTNKPENNFFIVRNIGNQYILNQGSIEYGVRILKTELLIFLGHSKCGAVDASMGDYSALPSSIVREVDHLALSIEKSQLTGDHATKWHQAVVNNTRKQVELAMKDFNDLVKKNKLFILGMVMDLDNHSGRGYGRIAITSCNGITNIEELKKIPQIASFFE